MFLARVILPPQYSIYVSSSDQFQDGNATVDTIDGTDDTRKHFYCCGKHFYCYGTHLYCYGKHFYYYGKVFSDVSVARS